MRAEDIDTMCLEAEIASALYVLLIWIEDLLAGSFQHCLKPFSRLGAEYPDGANNPYRGYSLYRRVTHKKRLPSLVSS